MRRLYPERENQGTHTSFGCAWLCHLWPELCVCVVCVYVSWSREQLIRPFQAAWDTWEQVNYGSHTHTLINPQRHAQPDGLNAVSGTPSQRDSSGKVSKNNLIRHKLSLDRVS